MKRTHITKGTLNLTLFQPGSPDKLQFRAEDMELEVTYDISLTALNSVAVANSDINLLWVRMEKDAILEGGNQLAGGMMLLLKKGQNVSTFFGKEAWKAWQEEIAEDMNLNPP